MISAMRHMCRSRDNLHSFRCVDGKSQTQVVSRLNDPQSTFMSLFVVVTYCCHIVSVQFGGLC